MYTSISGVLKSYAKEIGGDRSNIPPNFCLYLSPAMRNHEISRSATRASNERQLRDDCDRENSAHARRYMTSTVKFLLRRHSGRCCEDGAGVRP